MNPLPNSSRLLRGRSGLFARLPVGAATLLAAVVAAPTPGLAAQGWWLDDIHASLFLLSGRLDSELKQMRAQGGDTVLVQADGLPGQVLTHIAGRARVHQLTPVAWIEWPSRSNLQQAIALKGYAAVQIDDHFFSNPPLPATDLRQRLREQGKDLWCSFQPGQLSWERMQPCDHVDVQLYRLSCAEVEQHARRLGMPGWPAPALAVYDDGSDAASAEVPCQQRLGRELGLGTLVFKWKNPETALRTLWRHPLFVGASDAFAKIKEQFGPIRRPSLQWPCAIRSAAAMGHETAAPVTTAEHLHATTVLLHLRRRHLLDGYLLEVASLESDSLSPVLRRLAASPQGMPATAMDPGLAARLEEHHLIRRTPLPAGTLRLPWTFVEGVNFELTYSCNLACSHCLQDGLRPSGQPHWLPTEPIVRVLREVRQLGLARTGVNLTGGEIFSAGSPVLDLLATTASLALPTRINTNAWWGGRTAIPIGDRRFHNDVAVVAALRERQLGRLALSLDRRYEQYPELLDRMIRVAVVCEQAGQDYEVIATEPGDHLARTAALRLREFLGHQPRHLLLTPMETVDIGAAATSRPHNRALAPAELAGLIRTAPCATAGFHRPYYLHIGPDGGLRSCLYAPGAGWLDNVLEQPLAALLNAAAVNPIAMLYAGGDLDGFIARAVTPWRHLYVDPHHGCAASALLARIAELVHQLETTAGRPATAEELEGLHSRIAAQYLLVPADPASPAATVLA